MNLTTQEILKLKIPGLPTSPRALIEKAMREKWKIRKKQGRGGGFEYDISSMPRALQAQVFARMLELEREKAMQNAQALCAGQFNTQEALNEAGERAKNTHSDSFSNTLSGCLKSDSTILKQESGFSGCLNNHQGFDEEQDVRAFSGSAVPAENALNVDANLFSGCLKESKTNNTQTKVQAVGMLVSLLENGVPLKEALPLTVETWNKTVAGRANGMGEIRAGSLQNWYYKTKNAPPNEWLAILQSKTGKSAGKKAVMSEDAWLFFKSVYLTREKRSFAFCYRLTCEAAKANGWTVATVSSLQRRVEREIPLVQKVLMREGEYALSRLFPSQIRSVASIAAMDHLNGDGYLHNVWVRFPDGEVRRPKTWLWQDVRTRMILGFRCDKTENTDMIRLALLDVISQYGLPRALTIDNTRAAANKKMTGGVKNRYRFSVKEDEVKGIIPLLGINIHWTSVQFGKGRGQAKPIERAFAHGGLGEYVDKHPLLAGAYAGANVYEKPEYDKGVKPASYEDFITALTQGIQWWNETPNRKTEICGGTLSFKEAFIRDFAQAEKRPANRTQLTLLLTLHEEATLKENGTFTLKAGSSGSLKNRYQADALIGLGIKRVVARFEPNSLHEKVLVFSLEGEFLCEAVPSEKAGFSDTHAAREHNRAMREWVKHNKRAAQAETRMTQQEINAYLPDVDFESDFLDVALAQPENTENAENTEEKEFAFLQDKITLIDGNTVRVLENGNGENEELSDFLDAAFRGLDQLAAKRGLK